MSALDAAAIQQALHCDPAAVACQLLGEPNRALSSKRELRWGTRGSLALVLAGERRGLWHDHEVGQGGDVLALIQHVHGCSFPQALRIAAELAGGSYSEPARTAPKPAPVARADDLGMWSEIWRGTVPATASPVARYLVGRGLELPSYVEDIRFHPRCPRGRDRLPAMVAAMRDIWSNEIVGIHRTFLKADGSGKAPVNPAKMMLGRSKGAAVKLSPDDDVTMGLCIAEGIETGLALLGFGMAPCWSLSCAGGIKAFRVLAAIECLTIAVDHDDAGEAAAAVCAERWQAARREVRLIRAQVQGEDLADLAGRAAA